MTFKYLQAMKPERSCGTDWVSEAVWFFGSFTWRTKSLQSSSIIFEHIFSHGPNCSLQYIYIYIYSHPGVDRISDMFNPDFPTNKLEYLQHPQFLHVFRHLLQSFLANFGHGCGEILKKLDRISKEKIKYCFKPGR